MEYVDYENHRAVSFLYLLHAGSRQKSGGIFALRRLCGEILKSEQEEIAERREDDFLSDFGEGMKSGDLMHQICNLISSRCILFKFYT